MESHRVNSNNIGEKPTVTLYTTYINHHVGTPKQKQTSLTGPLFPIGIEHLIYMKFFCYGSSYISAAPPLIGQERSRNIPTPLQH